MLETLQAYGFLIVLLLLNGMLALSLYLPLMAGQSTTGLIARIAKRRA